MFEGKRDSQAGSEQKYQARQNVSPFTGRAKMIRHTQNPWSESVEDTGQEGCVRERTEESEQGSGSTSFADRSICARRSLLRCAH